MAAGRLVAEAALQPIRQQKSNGNRAFATSNVGRQLESPPNRPVISRRNLKADVRIRIVAEIHTTEIKGTGTNQVRRRIRITRRRVDGK